MRWHPWLLVAGLAMFACQPSVRPVVSPTAPACKSYCDVLEFYACEEARPNRRGRTCTQRCEKIEEIGYISIDPQCVVERKDSLAAIRRDCNLECKGGFQH